MDTETIVGIVGVVVTAVVAIGTYSFIELERLRKASQEDGQDNR
ncbi:MAG: hypothetical protein O3A10_15995 [Chloroflexi bacterium]|nr:hypothetical protein [Chloroflexota bacterium]MDA1147347.1 hypothetical protein [Chloroflexota bacterium]